MKKSKSKWADSARLDFLVYVHEWFPPFGWRYLVLPLAATIFAVLTLWPFYSGHNIPYRSTHTAIAAIERIDYLRPGPKEGFLMHKAFVLRIEGQDVVYRATFNAAPGDYVAVQYIVDFRGQVLVSAVSPERDSLRQCHVC